MDNKAKQPPPPSDGQVGWIKVPLTAIRPGWTVDRDIYSGTERLLSAGVAVTSSMLIALKQRNIEFVEVHPKSELAYTAKPEESDALADLLSSVQQLHEMHGIQQAIPQAQLEQAVNQIHSFFESIELGQAVDFNDVRETINGLVDQFLSNAHLAIKLLDLDSHDRYTYRHSINAGLLYLLVARNWLDYAELCGVVFGAVLHDLGKARINVDIINKPGPLNDSEWQVMRQHPVWSSELLIDSGANQAAISVARSHHERMDGQGYPDGLAQQHIDRYARLAAVCDVYDALTTKRSYKRKMDFAYAIDVLVQGCGTQFDAEIVNQFIRRVGRYPVGSFVRLSTGEIAIVTRTNEGAISRPEVSRVIDKQGQIRKTGERLNLQTSPELLITGIIPTPESLAK